MMCDMYVLLGRASIPVTLDIPYTPPEVSVAGGSISFEIGGGLFASGLGLIVACSAGLVAPPLVGMVAGASLASVGVIELAIDWKRKITETSKTAAEVQLLKLERMQKELDLKAAQMREHTASEAPSRIAPAAFISSELVASEAERWGITEEFSYHLLNRVLPEYLFLRQYLASIDAKPKTLRRG
jgi:hypothetical protein